jgi:uncharacterized RDD family membrane protein YckC
MTEASGPAMGQPAGPTAATAGLGSRFAARLLDGLIIGLPLTILFAIIGMGTGGLGLENWLGGAIFTLLWLGYYAYFESTTGATLGKKLVNIRVVAANGTSPSMEAAVKRNAWMLLGLLPFVGWLLQLIAVIVIAVTISSNEYNRGKHDEIADTGVMAS